MNIAQALRKHAEKRARMSLLEERIKKDFIMVEGKGPSYDQEEFDALVVELGTLRVDAGILKQCINTANNKVVDGDSVSGCLATRNRVCEELAFFVELRGMDTERYVLREGMKTWKRITDSKLDESIDRLTNERRRLDDMICKLNAIIEV